MTDAAPEASERTTAFGCGIAVAVTAAIAATVVVALYVFYVFAVPECVASDEGVQLLYKSGAVGVAVFAVAAWVVQGRSLRGVRTWRDVAVALLLPALVLGGMVIAEVAVEVIIELADLSEDAAACM